MYEYLIDVMEFPSPGAAGIQARSCMYSEYQVSTVVDCTGVVLYLVLRVHSTFTPFVDRLNHQTPTRGTKRTRQIRINHTCLQAQQDTVAYIEVHSFDEKHR